MKNTNILNEINEMKYLFDYQRGRVISEQYNDLYEVDEIGTATDATTTTTTVVGSTTTKTTRRATGLEVQKLLNTKYSAGLKEDGKIGPLTLGSMMTALEGGTSGGSTTATTTIAGGSTSTTTTIAGGSTGITTTIASSTPTGSGESDTGDL